MGRFVSLALLAHAATATAPRTAPRASARAPAFARAPGPARRRARAPPAPLCGSASRRRRPASALRAADAAPVEPSVLVRLELHEQFERWRFFQRLLDHELPPADVEAVLAATLRAYLRHGPTDASADNRNENGGVASPVLTAAGRRDMEGLVAELGAAAEEGGGEGEGRFVRGLVLPPVDYTRLAIDDKEEARGPVAVDPAALAVLHQIEALLPDPVEDEEAFQSAWDVVLSLHGREAVRLSELALQREREGGAGGADGRCDPENLQWRTVCATGRVLIHYDFLTKGVLEEGAFSATAADAP